MCGVLLPLVRALDYPISFFFWYCETVVPSQVSLSQMEVLVLVLVWRHTEVGYVRNRTLEGQRWGYTSKSGRSLPRGTRMILKDCSDRLRRRYNLGTRDWLVSTSPPLFQMCKRARLIRGVDLGWQDSRNSLEYVDNRYYGSRVRISGKTIGRYDFIFVSIRNT